MNLTKLEKIKTADSEAVGLQKSEAIAYLKSTDWYVIRLFETGKPIPDGVKNLRTQARSLLG